MCNDIVGGGDPAGLDSHKVVNHEAALEASLIYPYLSNENVYYFKIVRMWV